MTNYGRNRRVYASRGDKHWYKAARHCPSPYGENAQRKHSKTSRKGYYHKRVPRFRNKTLYCGPKYIVDPAHLRPCAPHNTTSYLIAQKDQRETMCPSTRWLEETLFGLPPVPAFAMYSPSAPHELDDSFESS